MAGRTQPRDTPRGAADREARPAMPRWHEGVACEVGVRYRRGLGLGLDGDLQPLRSGAASCGGFRRRAAGNV